MSIMNRREITQIVAVSGLAANFRSSASEQSVASEPQHRSSNSSFTTVRHGTELFVQDWGEGRPVLFLSPWALNSDIWGSHIATLNARGMRCVALDRVGHGRSSIPSKGYDLNTLSDDIAAVVDQRGLRDFVLVAYSMAALEAARFYTRHGSSRVARLVLAAPVSPCLTKTGDNPDGVEPAMVEMQHQLIARDYPNWIGENEAPFFTPETDSETRRWIKDMMLRVPLPAALACLRMAASADVRADLKRITCPTLIVHGDKDASVPIAVTRKKTARLIAGSRFVVYSGAPHALVLTHREQFLTDLLGFIET
jgi:pimeloyl-ACP methyl ester carboxylesterase